MLFEIFESNTNLHKKVSILSRKARKKCIQKITSESFHIVLCVSWLYKQEVNFWNPQTGLLIIPIATRIFNDCFDFIVIK